MYLLYERTSALFFSNNLLLYYAGANTLIKYARTTGFTTTTTTTTTTTRRENPTTTVIERTRTKPHSQLRYPELNFSNPHAFTMGACETLIKLPNVNKRIQGEVVVRIDKQTLIGKEDTKHNSTPRNKIMSMTLSSLYSGSETDTGNVDGSNEDSFIIWSKCSMGDIVLCQCACRVHFLIISC